MNNNLRYFYVLLAFLIALTVFPRAQALDFQDGATVEESHREAAEAVTGGLVDELFYFKDYIPPNQWGGWLGTLYIDFKDDDNSAATADLIDKGMIEDLRLWFKAHRSVDEYWYLRGRFYNESLTVGPGFVGDRKTTKTALDSAYYYIKRSGYRLQIGRQFVRTGRGLTYAGVHDGMVAEKRSRKWTEKAFITKTRPDEKNIDRSKGGLLDGSPRYFYGYEARYHGFRNRTVYAYALVENDPGRESPEDLTQIYDLDASFLGLGIEGQATPRLKYWTEAILEKGKSPVPGSNTARTDISASALIAGAAYNFKGVTAPLLTLEYINGSGDPNRASVTDTVGGNPAGTDDTNFYYFGIYPTGYALNPRISNLQISKLGFFFKPFAKEDWGQDLMFGFKYFIYKKNEAPGAMSDNNATIANTDIGSELDLVMTWRMTSDLFFFMNYGDFAPGAAYPAGSTNEKYTALGLQLVF